jgi:acyl-CoA synthetase (NDP forming)
VTAHALAQLIGELLSHASPMEMVMAMPMILGAIATKAGLTVLEHDASDEALVSPAIAREKLH